jgi:DNA (cytosine-5)-methyltransferase 1
MMRVVETPRGTVISLFSGALGLDLGLERSGFELRAAVEVNKWAADTITRHRAEHGVEVVRKRIQDVPTDKLLEFARVSVGDATVVSAGPSCQTFSTAGHRRSLGDDRGWLFSHFVRVVREAQPRFFVMENVRGVMSAAVSHRPLAKRGPNHPPLRAEERHGSAMHLLVKALRDLGYYVVFGLVDAADYGSAQHRWRLVFLGSRDGEDLCLPTATHGPQTGQEHRTLREALDGLEEEEDQMLRPLPREWATYLKQVPAGGNWRDLPEAEQRKALGAAYDSWGGRAGFFRRLAWDRPTPSVTTNPAAKATMLIHPDQTRALSLRELARLQGFPDKWTFAGGVEPQFRQVGNAVPVMLGQVVGDVFARVMAGEPTADPARCGVVACADRRLVERFNARPRTVLNPPRMRGEEAAGSLRAWQDKLGGKTREPLDVEILEAAA